MSNTESDASAITDCPLHGGWKQCPECAVARNQERLTRVWWDYAADAAEKRGLRLVLEQDGPGIVARAVTKGIVARAVTNLPMTGGASEFEGWSDGEFSEPDPTQALFLLTRAMQGDGEV